MSLNLLSELLAYFGWLINATAKFTLEINKLSIWMPLEYPTSLASYIQYICSSAVTSTRIEGYDGAARFRAITSMKKWAAFQIEMRPRLLLSGSSSSREVKAIQIHHLVPGRDKVMDKLLLGVGAPIDFRQRAELGV